VKHSRSEQIAHFFKAGHSGYTLTRNSRQKSFKRHGVIRILRKARQVWVWEAIHKVAFKK